jgi:dipeptide/tripeptide permease
MSGLAIIAAALVLAWVIRKMRQHERSWIPREHHAFGCSLCQCSYRSAAGLARHYTNQHTNETVTRLLVDGGPARTAAGSVLPLQPTEVES